jgi:hypothetical protein
MRLGRDSVERIRRHEVSRALEKVDLSPEEEEIIDLFSRSLVGRLLHGPISEVMERTEAELSFRGLPGPESPSGLEWHRGADKTPGVESDNQFRGNGKPYIECDRVSGKPA